MKQKRHIPVRTCIGCRRKRKKEEMIWLAHSLGGVIRVDGRKPHQGRGFYLCPDLQCLKMAKGRKKGVEFLGTMDVQSLLGKGLSERDKVCDRGGRE
jgi:predicted RNA-binding protein YlxR (DUF448 family)